MDTPNEALLKSIYMFINNTVRIQGGNVNKHVNIRHLEPILYKVEATQIVFKPIT